MPRSTSPEASPTRARWMSGINVLVGAWLFVASFVLGYVALGGAVE